MNTVFFRTDSIDNWYDAAEQFRAKHGNVPFAIRYHDLSGRARVADVVDLPDCNGLVTLAEPCNGEVRCFTLPISDFVISADLVPSK